MSENEPTVMGIKAISHILPHDYPFLLIDRIIEIDIENDRIVGKKNVTMNEEFFQGHFPGAPIMPGVLILEALAQTAGILIHKKGYDDKIAVLMSVNQAKFRRPVLPGDALYLHIQGIHFTARGGRVTGLAKVENRTVVEAEIGFGMVQKDQIGN